MVPDTLSPAAFARRDPAAQVSRFKGRTMGTGWSLLVVSPPDGVEAGVQAVFDRVVRQMSQWEPDSDLSRINRAAPGQWHALEPELCRVLAAAHTVAEASDGAFDPLMGELADMWGFGPAPAPSDVPDVEAIDRAVSAKGEIELDTLLLRARRGGQGRLDLSGIAKGFAVDLVAEWLIGQGMLDFLLEAGGELRGEGIRPDGQPWWVEIERPPDRTHVAPLLVALHGLSVATSGTYRRWLDVGGQKYPHTLDPRTGFPVTHVPESVTVFHPECVLADAWATALGVCESNHAMELATRHDLAVYVIDGGEERMSAAARKMLDM